MHEQADAQNLARHVMVIADAPVASVHSEGGHRVKVQMHFQRGQQPNAGNGPTGFGTDEQGNAPGDERSGTWVRVGGPAAGAIHKLRSVATVP